MRNFFICFLLAAVTVAVYWPAHRFSFVNYDDQDYVYENKHVLEGLTWSNAAWALKSREAANYFPLLWLSLLVDSSLFGPQHAGAFHVENFLLHALNTVLLFLILKKATTQTWPSAFVAAIFALHPAHVESVAWVTERKDVLSTAFLFLAIWSYLAYAQAKSGGKKWVGYFLTIGCFTCALLSKPMVVTLPFMLLLLDYWPLRRILVPETAIAQSRFSPVNLKTALLEKTPLFVLSIASSIMTYQVQHAGGTVLDLQSVPLGIRAQNIFVSYMRYLAKTLWPTNLSPYYPYHADWSAITILGCISLTLVISLLCLLYARRRPYLLVGWLWFLGTLVPVIGIVQAGSQSIADRYLYVPMIGLTIMAAWSATELAHISRTAVAGVGVLVLVAAGATAHHQLLYWSDTRTLFEHALRVINGNAVAHVQLGYLDAREGNTLGAMNHYLEAIRLDPADFVAEFNYANLLLKDHPAEAIEHYHNAAVKNPRSAKVQNNWGRAMIELNQPSEAVQHFIAAIQIDSNFPDPHANLGWLLLNSGRTDLAEREFHEALRIDPDFLPAKHGLEAIAGIKSAKSNL